MPDAYLEKIERLREGAAPRVVDLFAGCGGLSLGFQRSGFEIVGAVEFDREAAATHARNFHPERRPPPEGWAADITTVSPEDFAMRFGLGNPADCCDVLVGGPPCQSFARVGRAKLREVLEHPEAFRKDPRAGLYLSYLTYVRALKPLAILMENVPDVLNHGGKNIPGELAAELERDGYSCRYTLLNAAHYGVPQMRDRMILVGYHEALGAMPSFPGPTHWIDLPSGYHGTRSVALKHVRPTLVDGTDHGYVPSPEPEPPLPASVTAREALADLPPITKHLTGGLKKGPARFDELLPYKPGEPHPFALAMRTWRGFESLEGVTDHVIRYLPRDYPIFRRMSPGDQYPEAHAVAQEMFAEELMRRRAAGERLAEGSAAWEELKAAIVPPYDPGKFPNKWRKMEADRPSRTLMAHIGKDSYSHIHYDSEQARTISVREAARLQSFPDGFLFEGRMNAAFRQIGNAVPPLFAAALASEMTQTMDAALSSTGLAYAAA